MELGGYEKKEVWTLCQGSQTRTIQRTVNGRGSRFLRSDQGRTVVEP